MAHFAELDENNIVVKVHYCDNEHLLDENGVCCDEKGFHQCVESCNHERFVQTSRSGSIRAKWAAVGDYYDPDLDIFYHPNKPFPSWVLNTTIGCWEAPVSEPDAEDGFDWVWMEDEYQSSGTGWFKYPLLSPLDGVSGSFVEWNDQDKSYVLIKSPLTEDLYSQGYRSYYDPDINDFVVVEPPPKPDSNSEVV
jgi:hypothetical protein